VDLRTIKDVDKLKSLAFDQIQLIEQSQNNLRMIQTRIQQVEDDKTTPKTK